MIVDAPALRHDMLGGEVLSILSHPVVHGIVIICSPVLGAVHHGNAVK